MAHVALFMKIIKIKNAKYRNALLFSDKVLVNSANSGDPDQTAPDKDIYLLIGIAFATVSCIIFLVNRPYL